MNETIMMGPSYELYCFFEDGLLATKIITIDLVLIHKLKKNWLESNPGSNFTTVCKVTRENM